MPFLFLPLGPQSTGAAKNSLFCQFAAGEVEPVLPFEHFAVYDARRCAGARAERERQISNDVASFFGTATFFNRTYCGRPSRYGGGASPLISGDR